MEQTFHIPRFKNDLALNLPTFEVEHVGIISRFKYQKLCNQLFKIKFIVNIDSAWLINIYLR